MASIALVLAVALPLLDTGADPPALERLTLVGPDRVPIAVVDGEAGRVVVDARLDAMLSCAGADISVVHTHPRGLPLSESDLLQLTKVGVARVVALGADGSRFEAKRAARFDANGFQSRQYAIAHAEVVRLMRSARARRELPGVDDYIQHVTALGLQKAHVIGYSATFTVERSTLWSLYRPILGPIAEAAAARVVEYARAR